MQRDESRERKPAVGFDVALIAANLQGWQLKQPEQANKDWWVITRYTSDGRHLMLGLNPSGRYVHFKEYEDHDLAFGISCRDIEFVDISRGEIRFRGNVHYTISFDGKFHDVKLPNASFNDASIATRSYDFDKPRNQN